MDVAERRRGLGREGAEDANGRVSPEHPHRVVYGAEGGELGGEVVADEVLEEGEPYELVGGGDVEDACLEAHAGGDGGAPRGEEVLGQVEAVDAAVEVLEEGYDKAVWEHVAHGHLQQRL